MRCILWILGTVALLTGLSGFVFEIHLFGFNRRLLILFATLFVSGVLALFTLSINRTVRHTLLRRTLIFLLFVCLFVVAHPIINNWVDPFKITDPHDPAFDSTTFSILDYPTEEQLQQVLNILMPQGMPRCEVEEILILRGGAFPSTDHPNAHADRVTYNAIRQGRPEHLPWWKHTLLCTYEISVYYDGTDRLQRFSIQQACGLPAWDSWTSANNHPDRRTCSSSQLETL